MIDKIICLDWSFLCSATCLGKTGSSRGHLAPENTVSILVVILLVGYNGIFPMSRLVWSHFCIGNFFMLLHHRAGPTNTMN